MRTEDTIIYILEESKKARMSGQYTELQEIKLTVRINTLNWVLWRDDSL